MTLLAPRSIRAQLGPKALSHAADLFDHRASTIFSELFQNSRRAGATHIDITTEAVAPVDPSRTNKSTRVVLTDNGSGIASPEALLTFGGSAWDTELETRERAAGMGFYSLAARGVTVSSHDWTASISPAGFIGEELVDINSSSTIVAGTRLEFILADDLRMVADAIKTEAYYLPLSVKVNDETLSRAGFLDGAIATKDILGVRIGVFVNPAKGVIRYDHALGRHTNANLNFYGHAITTQMPAEDEIAPLVTAKNRFQYPVGGDTREFVVRVDIIDAPDLRLVLPARNTVIENAALATIRTEAHRFIFETLASLEEHMLGAKQLERARAFGIVIDPPSRLILHGWHADTSEDVVVGDPQVGSIIFDPSATEAPPDTCLFPETQERQIEAQIGLALDGDSTTLPFALVQANFNYAGFPGFDVIPHASANVEIRLADKTITVPLKDEADGTEVHKALGHEAYSEHWLLVDDIALILSTPTGSKHRISLDVYVDTIDERGESAYGVVRRGASPDDVTQRVMDVTWSWNDDDQDSARDEEYGYLLSQMRHVLLPAGEAHAKTVYDAVNEALSGLLYATPARPAVKSITVSYDDAIHARTTTVTLTDGTVYSR